MWLDVKIPYEPKGQLALAYNRAMKETTAPWVLLLDHDVFISLNPHWYDYCLEKLRFLESIDNKVGLVTCVTNGNIGRCQEPSLYIGKTPDLDQHVAAAKEIYYKDYNKIQKISKQDKIAGYFMLVKREVWESVRFEDQKKGVNKVDHAFLRSILETGHGAYVLKGLYVYHKKGIRKLKWEGAGK